MLPQLAPHLPASTAAVDRSAGRSSISGTAAPHAPARAGPSAAHGAATPTARPAAVSGGATANADAAPCRRATTPSPAGVGHAARPWGTAHGPAGCATRVGGRGGGRVDRRVAAVAAAGQRVCGRPSVRPGEAEVRVLGCPRVPVPVAPAVVFLFPTTCSSTTEYARRACGCPPHPQARPQRRRRFFNARPPRPARPPVFHVVRPVVEPALLSAIAVTRLA